MKLTKEQTQKLALGGVTVCAVIYAYFEFALAQFRAFLEA